MRTELPKLPARSQVESLKPEWLAKRFQLSMPTAAYLQACHAALLRALLDPACELSEYVDVELLPEPTRKFLWRAIRQHRPALADLLSSPIFTQARTTMAKRFKAHVNLPADDVLAALRMAAPGELQELDGNTVRPATPYM